MITDFSKYKFILIQASLLLVMVEESFPHVEKDIHLSEREFFFFSELFKKRKSDGNGLGSGWIFKSDITITVKDEQDWTSGKIPDRQFKKMEEIMWRTSRLPDRLYSMKNEKFPKYGVSFSHFIESTWKKIRISPSIKGENIKFILIDEKMEGN